MRAILLCSGLMAAAALGLDGREAGAQPPVAPDWMSIQGITASGSGCPFGTIIADIAPDKRTMTLIPSDFEVSAGPGIDPAERDRFCTISIRYDHPEGWSFSSLGVDYEAQVSLQGGLGRLSGAFWFQGQPARAMFDVTFSPLIPPPRPPVPLSASVWSPCDARRPMIVSSALALRDAGNWRASGSIRLTQLRFGLTWRRC